MATTAPASNVRVGVRVRPQSSNELAADSRVVTSHPSHHMVRIGDGTGDKTFSFDYVFPSHISQRGPSSLFQSPQSTLLYALSFMIDIFNATAPNLINDFLRGYNVTVGRR